MSDHRADIEAIKQLKARYFRLMDTKQWAEMGEVFADDVDIDMTSEGGLHTTSRDAFMPFLEQAIGNVVTVHHGHMPEIVLTSETTARGTWAMEDKLWFPAGTEGLPGTHMHGYGHYHETYEKSGGEWRIKTLRLTRLRVDFG